MQWWTNDGVSCHHQLLDRWKAINAHIKILVPAECRSVNCNLIFWGWCQGWSTWKSLCNTLSHLHLRTQKLKKYWPCFRPFSYIPKINALLYHLAKIKMIQSLFSSSQKPFSFSLALWVTMNLHDSTTIFFPTCLIWTKLLLF